MIFVVSLETMLLVRSLFKMFSAIVGPQQANIFEAWQKVDWGGFQLSVERIQTSTFNWEPLY